MKIIGDYHVHTNASDGHGTISDVVLHARKIGLEEVAVTEHSFASLLLHHTQEKFFAQKDFAKKENEKGGLKVYVGIEGNLVDGNGNIDVPDDIIRKCDVLHVGFHRLLQFKYIKNAREFILVNGWASKKRRQKLIEYNTKAYLNAIEKYPIDVLVHLSNRALVDVERICRAAVEKDIYIELNAKHIDAFEDCIEKVVASGAKLIVGTDSHKYTKVGDVAVIVDFLNRHNVDLENVYGIGKKPTFKDKSKYGKN